MIDNPDQVERLMAKMNESLPLFARVNHEVAAAISGQSPAAAPPRGYAITRVKYAGDEGGIICKVELGPENHGKAVLRQLRICGSVRQNRSVVRSLRTRSIGSNGCDALLTEAKGDNRLPDEA